LNNSVNKEKMMELYLSGKTLAEVGREFGISKQRVFRIIGGTDRHRRVTDEQLAKIKYIGLRNWMKENNVSLMGLTRLLYDNTEAENWSRTRNRIYGRTDMGKRFIDKLITITGLSYEVLFSEE
jgi:hypothetical protein